LEISVGAGGDWKKDISIMSFVRVVEEVIDAKVLINDLGCTLWIFFTASQPPDNGKCREEKS
jgi:hypothetical protein